MNDNGLPNDPLSAAQFNVPALTRHSILQNVDRTNGEHFPTISGDFFHVDSIDFPARISFGNTDPEQSIPLIPGLEVRGRFSGITIYHDNWSGSADRPKIQFNLGRGNVLTINESQGKNGIHLPGLITTASTTALNASIPVPYGYHLLNAELYNRVTNAASPENIRVSAEFLTLTGIVVPPALTRNGLVYNAIQNYATANIVQWIQTGANQWSFITKFFDLPIPSGAERLRFIYNLGVAVTSNDAVSLTGYAR
jgi:hypothetical protein